MQTTKKTPNFLEVLNCSWWRRTDSNRGHCGYEPHALANWATPPIWSWWPGLNWWPYPYQGYALPTELHQQYLVGCGGRTWTTDLRVMSPTSYQLLHPAMLSWWMGLDSNQRSETRQIYSLLPLTTREPIHRQHRYYIIPRCFCQAKISIFI